MVPAIRQRTVASQQNVGKRPGAELLAGKSDENGSQNGSKNRSRAKSSSSTAGGGDTRRGRFHAAVSDFCGFGVSYRSGGVYRFRVVPTRNSNYCNGSGYGYLKDQPVSISLQPQTTGLSVAYSPDLAIASPLSAELQWRLGFDQLLHLRPPPIAPSPTCRLPARSAVGPGT